MKKLLALAMMLLTFASVSIAAPSTPDLPVIVNQLGSGTPAPMISVGTEAAKYVDDGYYHTPQYMPNFPTAATIWPRVVEVDCVNEKTGVVCDGYNWSPKMGRGEYLFVVPRLKQAVQPILVPVPGPTTVITVIKEVPVKPGRE